MALWIDKGIRERRFMYATWTDECAPVVVSKTHADGTTIDEHWTITLNEYQRANLLWLLCDLVGYARKGIKPFTHAHTGDWVGEIANILRVDHDVDTVLPANCDVETIAKLVIRRVSIPAVIAEIVAQAEAQ